MYTLCKTIGKKQPTLQDHSQKMPPSRKLVHNISLSSLNTSQRCCSHCNSVHPTTSSTKSRRIRAPHCRNDRQHPLTSSSHRHHYQYTNTDTDVTRIPRKLTRCLNPKTTTKNKTSYQVSHFTTINLLSSKDTYLITDTTTDGHTSFHTLQSNYQPRK